MKIPAIIGPTAVGKSWLARELLDKIPLLRFISCDSRKVYRFLDVGTAKPHYELRPYVSLIDIKFPDEVYNAQQFAIDAESLIEEILSKGAYPIVIGGTPLYYVALFKGLFEFPSLNQNIRKELLKRLKTEGVEALYRELKRVDPESARNIHPNDWIRITRALEVYLQSGIPMSELRRKRRKPKFRPLYIGILRERKELYERINRRVEKMFAMGLVDETERVLRMGYSEELPSLNSIGYKEVIQYLKGIISLERAELLIKRRTRVYSRRQMYFFNSFDGVNWVMWSEKIVDQVQELIKKNYGL